jgi:hypothetical protein
MAANSTWRASSTGRAAHNWRKTDLLTAGEGPMAWQQLLEMEQAQADDPDAVLTTKTLTDGLFRMVFGSTTTAYDGYRERVPAWSVPLLDLEPGFDPSRHLLELAADWRSPGQFTLPGSNTGAGLFIGVSDRVLTDRTTINAAFGGLAVAGVANFSARHFAQTTAAGNSLAGMSPKISRLTLEWALTSGNVYRPVQSLFHYDPAGVPPHWLADTSATLLPTFGALSGWRVCIGAFRQGAVAATGQDVRAKLFWRVTERQSTVPS